MEDLSQTHFETQEDDEHVVLLLRAHQITNLAWIAGVALLALFGAIAAGVNIFFGNGLPVKDSLLLLLVWWLVLGGFALQRFLSWYFNVYIVTDKKIVDVDFLSLFYKQISETPLENIQDSTHRSVGFFQNRFDYGDLVIQTAGEKENFDFNSIPDPDGVQEKIMHLAEEAREKLGVRNI